MRLSVVGVLLMALMLGMTGCRAGGTGVGVAIDHSSPSPHGETLVIWADKSRAEAMSQFVNDLDPRRRPAVQIQAVTGDLLNEFLSASRSGNVPDIVLGRNTWVGTLIKNGAIDSLSLTAAQRGSFTESAIKALSYDNQLYGLPLSIENPVLYRNKELVPDIPRTIEEAIAIGNQLKGAGRVSEVLSVEVGEKGNPYHIYPLFSSAGGYLFGVKSGGDVNQRDFGLSKTESVSALTKIASLGEKGSGVLKRSVTRENAVATFAASNSPFLIAGPEALPEIKRSGLGYEISPVPGFYGGKQAVPLLSVSGFFVSARARNRALAHEFIVSHLSSIDCQKALSAATPAPPALTIAFDSVRHRDADIPRMLDAARGGAALPTLPDIATVIEVFGKVQAAIIGGADIPAVLSSAVSEISTKIE